MSVNLYNAHVKYNNWEKYQHSFAEHLYIVNIPKDVPLEHAAGTTRDVYKQRYYS
jgi:hypothetical protein